MNSSPDAARKRVALPSPALPLIDIPPFHRGPPITELNDEQALILADVWESLDQGYACLQWRQEQPDGSTIMQFGVSPRRHLDAMVPIPEIGYAGPTIREGESAHLYQVLLYVRGQEVFGMEIEPRNAAPLTAIYKPGTPVPEPLPEFESEFEFESGSEFEPCADHHLDSAAWSPRAGSSDSDGQATDAEPVEREQSDPLAALPNVTRQDKNYRYTFKGLLRHLDSLGETWLAVKNRVPALGNIVNDGIKTGALRRDTRAALKHLFGLELPLQSGVRQTPQHPEHQELMKQLPPEPNATSNYHHLIAAFFCFLERKGKHWSMERGDPNDSRPPGLEALVNASIAAGVQRTTRAALNYCFRLNLQGAQRRYGLWEPGHRALMRKVSKRTDLKKQDRARVKQFLLHLQDNPDSPALFVGADGEVTVGPEFQTAVEQSLGGKGNSRNAATKLKEALSLS